jgi:3-oxoadipate enol-lactonase
MEDQQRPEAPALPPGRPVELPGRGTTFVRELPGPPGAATVVLLHGWTVTADLNWFACYAPLARRFRVVALDHRGHGRGIRSARPFRLADCADDAVALADVLGIDRFVPVGYSMGGPIAQLVWRRHPERVEGLVLCATSRNFAGSREEKLGFAGLAGLALAARVAPPQVKELLADEVIRRRTTRRYEDWALEQVRRSDWRAVLEAGRALGTFSSREWIGEVDVPTAVVVTTQDPVVPPRRQLRLAASIPDAVVLTVEGDHASCATAAHLFVPALLQACDAVVWRARRRTRA